MTVLGRRNAQTTRPHQTRGVAAPGCRDPPCEGRQYGQVVTPLWVRSQECSGAPRRGPVRVCGARRDPGMRARWSLRQSPSREAGRSDAPEPAWSRWWGTDARRVPPCARRPRGRNPACRLSLVRTRNLLKGQRKMSRRETAKAPGPPARAVPPPPPSPANPLTALSHSPLAPSPTVQSPWSRLLQDEKVGEGGGQDPIPMSSIIQDHPHLRCLGRSWACRGRIVVVPRRVYLLPPTSCSQGRG